MKNTFGNALTLTLSGESHGPAVGATLDGLTPGIPVNEETIRSALALRRPQKGISTAREENDRFKILSGVFEGRTTGTPFTVVIPNEDARSGDYIRGIARPGHADLTAHYKYHGFEDYRGGGHFSGRLTAAIVAVCAPVREALAVRGIRVGTHILSLGPIRDRDFGDPDADVRFLSDKLFPVLDEEAGEAMKARIREAAEAGDSLGGVLETLVTGVPAGLGEPFFDSAESELAHAMFSVPAVKGVEFGAGFSAAKMTGSEANDPIRVNPTPGAEPPYVTLGNHSGGINGGITNGMPILMRTAVKPTPSVGFPQQSVDLIAGINAEHPGGGRHDPAVVHRARAVVDSLTAFVIADLLAVRFGTDCLAHDIR